MRLTQLHIENFGHYNDRTFQFEPQSINVLYGPNEAGKSTLLQVIREVLFGFPHQSSYLFADSKGDMAATVEAQLDSGVDVRFRRRKGRKNTVTGEERESGRKIDEKMLDELLGGASLALYQHVFGFSLRELEDGEESLRGANLTETLFGSGLGNLTHFRALKDELDQELKSLYSARGQRPLINSLMAQIKSSQSALKESMLRPREYAETRKNYESLEDRVRSVREQLAGLRKKREHTAQLQEAHRVWKECRPLRLELDELPDVVEITEDQSSLYHATNIRVTKLEDELTACQRSESSAREKLEQLALSPDLLTEAGTIKSLVEELGRVRDCRRDIPLRQIESREKLTELRVQLRDLGDEWSVEKLRDWAIAPADRIRVDELASEADEIAAAIRQHESEEKRLARELKDVETRLDGLGAAQDVELRLNRLSLASGLQRDLERCSQMRQAYERESRKRQSEAQQLSGQIPDFDSEQLSHEMAIPLKSIMQEFREKSREIERQQSEASSEREHCERSIRELEGKLQELTESRNAPSAHQLQELREQRDECLASINDGDSSNESSSDSPSLEDRIRSLQDAIAECDRCADQRFENAETVALAEKTRRDLEQAEREREAIEKKTDRLDGALKTILDDWELPWKASGVRPLLPDAMMEWADRFDAWRMQSLQADEDHAELVALESATSETAHLIRETLDDPPGELAAIAEAAIRASEQCRESESQRKLLDEQSVKLKNSLESARDELQRRQSRQADWGTEWETALTGISLSQTAEPRAVTGTISTLMECRQLLREADEFDHRIHQMQSEVERFETAVGELHESVHEDSREITDSIAALESLSDDLERARESDAVSRKLEEDLAAARSDARALQEELQKAAKESAELLERVGVEKQEEFESAEQVSTRRRELTDSLTARQRTLRVVLPGVSSEDIETQLEEFDFHQAELDLRGMDSEIARLDEQYQEMSEELGVARQTLSSMDGESRAARHGDQLQSDLARLSDVVDEWMPRQLAALLLQQSVEAFQRRHQPALLNSISELVHVLTEGRYVGIERRLDDEGTLLLKSNVGVTKTPDQLSTGTREQLYLAIRLAFLNSYCDDNESLPVVMDDVFVNFDGGRARASAGVLGSLVTQGQVLYLTCHEHVVEMFQQLEQPVNVINLQDHVTPPVDDSPGKKSPKRKKTSTRRKKPAARTGSANELFPPDEDAESR